MKIRLLTALVVLPWFARISAAEDSAPAAAPAPAPAPSTAPAPTLTDQEKLEKAIRLRLAEHALRRETEAATVATPETGIPAPDTPAPPTASAPKTDAPAAKPANEPATLMPRVEVNKSRITEEAIQLQEKDRAIAQEKKNATPTALDNSLNDPGVSHALSIFGGASSEDRARVADERVELLQAERDLIEQIAQARTPEERDDLKKQLNDLKTARRELDREPADERK